MTRRLRGIWLGTRPYRPVLALQEQLWNERAEGRGEDTVLLLEHTPVVTLGKGADPAHVLLGEDALAARGLERVVTNRGGDVTLHAPGQLVGYPIVDLKPDRCDVRRFVRDLAEVMRRVASRHGISSGTVDQWIGLWVDRASVDRFPTEGTPSDLAKIGAIGVRISRWVTMHGFALNVTTSVDLFQLIVPCGIREHGVTSIQELTGTSPSVRGEAEAAHQALADVLGRRAMDLEDWSTTSLPIDASRGGHAPEV